MAEVIAVIVVAAMIASIASELIVDPGRRTMAAQSTHLVVLAVALVARAAMTFGHDRYAHRAAARSIAELRSAALATVTDPEHTSPRLSLIHI